jgi:hypothetical protein
MHSLKLTAAVVVALAAFTSEASAQVQVQPTAVSFFPRHTQGDRDFGGNGPHVDLEVSLMINPNDRRELLAVVSMRAVETGGDRTTAEGWQAFVIYRSPTPLKAVRSHTFFNHSYRDTNHRVDTFVFRGGVVSRLDYVGDTRGDEAGTRTGVAIQFHPVLVE